MLKQPSTQVYGKDELMIARWQRSSAAHRELRRSGWGDAGARVHFGRRLRWLALALVGALAAALVWARTVEPSRVGSVEGSWSAEDSTWRVRTGDSVAFINLELKRTGASGSWSMGQTLEAAELDGMGPGALAACKGPVRWRRALDAGTFELLGQCAGGRASGRFTFTPDPAYLKDMAALGYREIGAERALDLGAHGVDRAWVRALAQAGYARVPLDQLIAARIHDVQPAFIRELATLGYTGLSLDDLIAMRVHGASADFARSLSAAGLKDLSADDLVPFRVHGVTPEFVRALAALGYDGPSANQLVSLRVHGASPEFVSEVRALGYPTASIDDLVALRVHGITPEDIRAARARLGASVTLDDIVARRIHGQDDAR